ncbi:MAG: FprA family A-type flavoprotein [Bacteroidales bacterium]|jgi:flavorubredoxin|nr:FprA family A-type flavoprotein [Bacteroidales bacterium]
MIQKIKLSEKIYWIGVNDRHTHLFENFWPLPYGVSYNSYLIDDEKVALIDTVEVSFMSEYLQKIKSILGDRTIDYLVVNHMEPDHSGSIQALLQAYPDLKIIGNCKTAPMLEGFYKVVKNVVTISEGDSVSLGEHMLNFYMIPMVHWPESMVTYESSKNILFSNDAFGSFGTLDGGVFDNEINFSFYEDEMRRYYANIVGKYGTQVQKALEKLGTLEIKTIAPSHGPIWRDHISKIIALYDQWSKYEGEEGVVIIYGTLYGHTAQMADIIARSIAEEGIKNIRTYDASKTHSSYLLNDIWKYKGVIIGSSSYNGGIFTPVSSFLKQLLGIMPKNKLLAIFGSMSWGGGAVRALEPFAQDIKWNVVTPAVEVKHAANDDDQEALISLGKAMAKALKENV